MTTTMKAVRVPQPRASKIAAGQLRVENKPWATSHRGETLLVSAEIPRIEPAGYALGVAALVDCRPAGHRPGSFDWLWSDARPVKIFPVEGSEGIFDVVLPSGGLRIVDDLPFTPERAAGQATGRSPQLDPSGVPLASGLRAARDALTQAAAGLAATPGAHRAALGVIDDLRVSVAQLIDSISRETPFQMPPRASLASPAVRPLGLALAEPELDVSDLDILVVDGSPLVGRSLQRALAGAHGIRVVDGLVPAFREIRTRIPDVVVCEWDFGPETAVSLLAALTERHPQVRRVLYSFAGADLLDGLLADKLIDAAVVKPATRRRLIAAMKSA
jgi:hypothetical protein